MLEDDFLKEKQNIREKMLRFSRAINQGKPLDNELQKELTSDDILRKRFTKRRIKTYSEFEYEPPYSKKSNIYLKEDLINVKLEEKRSLASVILSRFKKKRKKKNNELAHKKTKKIFAFLKKSAKPTKQILNNSEEKNSSVTSDIRQSKSTIKTEKQIKAQELTQLKEINIAQSLKNLQKEMDTQEIPKTQILKKESQENQEDKEKTKNILLEGFSGAIKEERNLSFNHLLFAILAVSFALFLFAPQIYIRNQIYYLSREIAGLKTEENVLDEENKELNRRLEKMRFQNQILDYLE
ncbi:hypothetical protein OQH60_00530 [Campylobacter sp. MIT 21-1685]|uniref:hypothetical protein n=1 Tax=unclassified Campylobacter TaxID=2593542 RepID=UPI00224A59D9|nr:MULTISPECIES: hypothetical protein [unclassified Campylobacter]MCX2682329.1 hypothetical protein [Campylobacter sp. MIT 21-1684]MCX2750609.1 hypothetical protein [Campylobacter sp. MIT 21-1682]MCX2806844.1 hypothetical protein [Campylobacter sp. MIT 21-1685]